MGIFRAVVARVRIGMISQQQLNHFGSVKGRRIGDGRAPILVGQVGTDASGNEGLYCLEVAGSCCFGERLRWGAVMGLQNLDKQQRYDEDQFHGRRSIGGVAFDFTGV